MAFFQSFLILFWATLIGISSKEEVINWKVTGDSMLEVLGTTNVSNFACENYEYTGQEYLIQRISEGQEVGQWSGEVKITSKNFDCNNALMTKDFKKTIEVEKFPVISVKFLGLTKESETATQKNLMGQVVITMVGISRKYDISCVFLASQENSALLSGERRIQLSDFKIEPPEKFFGAVKVSDEIKVNFSLVLERQHSLASR